MKRKDPNFPEDSDNDARPRGILSETDREWIKGKKQYDSRQGANKRRREVHERIRNAIYDLELLLEYPEKIENNRIYIGEGVETPADRATPPAVGFLLRHRTRDAINNDRGKYPGGINIDALESALDNHFAAAIRRILRIECRLHQDEPALNLTDFEVSVDTTITYSKSSPDWLQKIEEGLNEGIQKGAIAPGDVYLDTSVIFSPEGGLHDEVLLNKIEEADDEGE